MEKYIKSQIEILDELKIVYQSIDIFVKRDKDNQIIRDEYDRFKKYSPKIPTYQNKILETNYKEECNSTMIPLRERYNLFGVNVDNKNETIEFFNNLCIENEFDKNTLTVLTVQNEFHYYFRLNDEQREVLKNFNATNGKVFGGKDIDIKYNNQFFYGPSYINVDKKIYKYEFIKYF